jgi:hypothetical protein
MKFITWTKIQYLKLTNLLSPWSWDHERLIVAHPLKKLPAFYWSPAFTIAGHWSLALARWIQSHFIDVLFNIILPSTSWSPQWSLSCIRVGKMERHVHKYQKLYSLIPWRWRQQVPPKRRTYLQDNTVSQSWRLAKIARADYIFIL